jgi:hypothetical protein
MRHELQKCAPLVEVREGHVYITHQSVRDYLIRDTSEIDELLIKFHFQPEEENFRMAMSCLSCLEDVFQSNPPPSKWLPIASDSWEVLKYVRSMKPRHQYFHYAMKYWPVHTRLAATKGKQILNSALEIFFSGDMSITRCWWANHDLTPFFFKKAGKALGVSRYGYALEIALYHGILEWVRLSLPPINELTRPWSTDRSGLSPTLYLLWIAINGGHMATTELLLNHGCRADWKRGEVLEACVRHGKVAMYRLLVERGGLNRLKGIALTNHLREAQDPDYQEALAGFFSNAIDKHPEALRKAKFRSHNGRRQ